MAGLAPSGCPAAEAMPASALPGPTSCLPLLVSQLRSVGAHEAVDSLSRKGKMIMSTGDTIYFEHLSAHDTDPRTGGEPYTLVMIHGLASESSTWDGVVERLVYTSIQDHPVNILRMDLKGHGKTLDGELARGEKPEAVVDYRRHAQNVIELMETLGVKKAILVGHSMGGGIATEITAQSSDLDLMVKGLMKVSSYEYRLDSARGQLGTPGSAEADEIAEQTGQRAVADAVLDPLIVDKPGPARESLRQIFGKQFETVYDIFKAHIEKDVLKSNHLGSAAELTAEQKEWIDAQALNAIASTKGLRELYTEPLIRKFPDKIPVAVVSGKDDELVPSRISDEFTEALVRSHDGDVMRDDIPGVGHRVPEKAPARLAQDIEVLVEKVIEQDMREEQARKKAH